MRRKVHTIKRVAEIKAEYLVQNEIEQCKISSSMEASKFARLVFPIDIELKEAFISIYLNRANKTQGFAVISTGGLSGTVVDPKLIFQHGLLCNAASIIICHNHPSGNKRPSRQDIEMTKRIKEVGVALDMPLLDHLILTKNSYSSFSDEGLF